MKQKNRFLQTSSFMLLIILLCASISSARIIYVDDDALGLNDGSSWKNAYTYLQDALYDANSAENSQGTEEPVEIRVAQGFYTPDKGQGFTEGDYNSSFELVKGVTLTGGYAGLVMDELLVDPNTRDIELYQTILSGDLLNNDSNDYDPNNLVTEETFFDNSFHVINGSFADGNSVLDGFTITGGNAGGYAMIAGYFDDFDSSSYGGGLYINSAEEGPAISNCTFQVNAAYYGGAIYIKDSKPYINNCKFTKNSANYYYNYKDPMGGYGGAVCNLRSDAILENCEFVQNLAGDGAGISIMTDSNAIITNCQFLQNTANLTHGGGIFISSSNTIIKDCNFCDNLSFLRGGAIGIADFSKSIIDGCIFQANRAEKPSGMGYTSGGAIYNNNHSEPNIADCFFTENFASYSGGAMANQNANPNLINCTFSGNHSLNSGAFDNTQNFGSQSNPKFLSCVFSNNSASFNGGVMQNSLGSVLFENCIFTGNKAYSWAGVVINSAGKITLINCTATGNYALDSGSFAYNISYKYPPNLLLLGSIDLLNCIIWNEENAISNQKDSILMINYCDIQNGLLGIDDPNGGLSWGDGNFDEDPLFIQPGLWIDVNDPNIIVEPNDPNAFWIEGDYHLQSTGGHYDSNSQSWILDDVNSPCIDTGDPNSTFENEPLPNGGRINIGAFGGTSQASLSMVPPIANKEPDEPNQPDDL